MRPTTQALLVILVLSVLTYLWAPADRNIPDAATAKPAFGEAENCDGERDPVRGETAAETEEVRCDLKKTRDKSFVMYQKGFSHSANKEKK